jgi:hypothetical protein
MPQDMHETAPTQFVEAGGIRFAYRRFGRRGGTPLLLLGYFTSNLDRWDPKVTNGFAAKRGVILVGYPGIGGSSGETPSTVAPLTKACLEFCRALGLTRFDVLGFSLGGMIAQQLAADHPEMVRRIILTGTGPRGGEGMVFEELSADELDDEVGLIMNAFFTQSEPSRTAGRAYLERLKLRADSRDAPVSKQAALAGGGVGDVCSICSDLIASPVMSKAVRLALNLEKQRPENLASRILINHLTGLLTTSSAKPTAEVTSIGIPKRYAESFLREKLGSDIWKMLHSLTRADLVEAEIRFSLASKDLAAGRADWGSFYMDYARAIEREVRLHLDPLVKRLNKAHRITEESEIPHRELGYYVNKIRDLRVAIRKKTFSISEIDHRHIIELSNLFTKNGFIVVYRNVAAHGNKQISDLQYLKCREGIFVGKLFGIVVNVS